MTTSGTVNYTQLDVAALIEKSFRKCGKNPAIVASELLLEAQSELFLILSSLINDGVPLWTVSPQIYGVHINQNLLQFSSGTLDVRTMMYRTNVLPTGGTAFSSAGGTAANAFDQDLNTACTQTVTDGYISYDFGSPVVITTVGMLPNSTQTLNPVYEYSSDGVNWTQATPLSSAASSFTAGTWFWQDVPNLSSFNSARYFRVRETSGGTLDITELVFGQFPSELPMARINQDDYQNLPTKSQPGRPLQFWFDRQITPQAWLWPASQYEFNTVVAWRRREIQDVGSFTNTLELPNRWLDPIIWDLAFRMALMPEMAVDPGRLALLERMSPKMMNRSWTEERDASPIYYQAGIGGYTR